MKQIEQDILDIVLSYFEGHLTDEESSRLRDWIGKDKENRHAFLQMKEIWLAIQAESASERFNSDLAYERFRERVAAQVTSHQVRRRFGLWQYAAAAAIAALLIGISFNLGKDKVTQTFADIVMEAPLGSRSRVVLPDSTEVWLNAGSSIMYSQGFGVKDRIVKLNGEGYFSVTKDPSKPFSVLTDELGVKVLGTKFNFRNYAEDTEVIVTLEEGRISVSNFLKKEPERVLEPNQRMTLDKGNGMMTIERTIASNSSLWREGQLFFDEDLLTDIVKELERNYNVSISIDNEALKSYRFYCDFEKKDMTIDDVLDALTATGKVSCRKDGRNISLF